MGMNVINIDLAIRIIGQKYKNKNYLRRKLRFLNDGINCMQFETTMKHRKKLLSVQ